MEKFMKNKTIIDTKETKKLTTKLGRQKEKGIHNLKC